MFLSLRSSKHRVPCGAGGKPPLKIGDFILAIYHLTVKTGSKAKGQSAKAKSDYISREGKYQKDQDEVLHKSSGNMPGWADQEPGKYWEAADTYERKNGSLFREVEFALPVELSRQDQVSLAESFARELSQGELPYSLAVHRGKDSNPHCHLVLSERVNDGHDRTADTWFRRAANKGKSPETGGARKSEIGKNAANRKAWLESTRALWAERANQALEQAGQQARIDHRTLDAQGIERIPVNLSMAVIQMETKGIKTEKVEEAARIMEANAQIKELENVRNSHGKDHPSQRKPDGRAASRTDRTVGSVLGGLESRLPGSHAELGSGSRVTARDLEEFDTAEPRGTIIDSPGSGVGSQPDHERSQPDHMADDRHSRGSRLAGRDSSRGRIMDFAQGSLHQKQGNGNLGSRKRSEGDKRPSAMKPPHIKAKEKSWDRQSSALGSPAYRITLTDPTGKAKPWNMGKGQGKDGEEKFYTKEEIKALIPTLSAKNAQGRNIFITPIDPKNHYLVLDDSTQAQVDELERHGFKPALTQESSPGNIQAIFKATKIKSLTEQKAANNVVQRLNREFGDPNFTGVIHPFRMAGFTNPKPKHKDAKGNSPFVQIRTAQGGTCQRMSKALKQPRIDKAVHTRKAIIKAVAQEKKRVDGLEHADHAFCLAWHKVKGLAVSKGWTLDNSKIDFRACKEILSRYSKEKVKAALVKVSPSIETRHSDLRDYANRTVERADQERIQEQAQSKRHSQSRGPSM